MEPRSHGQDPYVSLPHNVVRLGAILRSRRNVEWAGSENLAHSISASKSRRCQRTARRRPNRRSASATTGLSSGSQSFQSAMKLA